MNIEARKACGRASGMRSADLSVRMNKNLIQITKEYHDTHTWALQGGLCTVIVSSGLR